MKKTIFFLLLLVAVDALHAQPTTAIQPTTTTQPTTAKDFAGYANDSHSSMVTAYQQRDIPRYRQLLNEFLDRYEHLDSAGRQYYVTYCIDANYDLACTYSLLHQHHAALDWLEKSIRAGYTDYHHILTDPDLAGLRNTERFRRLVLPLRAVGDYLYILGKAGRYNPRDSRSLPPFRYQPATDSNLIALRTGLHLDSIAGSGSDVDRVLHLLHWMHDWVPHDGNHNNPPVMNAMNLIAVCKKEHRGLNCRGLAIALNECYLALGYASRFITCQPKDSLHHDPDCHVIDMVYIPSLKKWVWIDPTNDAYVMDEQGNLLGPGEVRQRLIDHRPLIVNPDANWNHQQAVSKEDYLYNYMAKNLYMLTCPADSRYDLETAGPGKKCAYIRLLPLDYFKQRSDQSNICNTNNPSLFWTAPN
jgi:hypothetical protein